MNSYEITERDPHVIAMYQDGMSLRAVAYEFYLTPAAIAIILARNSVKRRPMGYKPGWQKKR